MIQILFICHGNICRSPMAESIFSHLLSQRGLEGACAVSSAATHPDELGNPPHRGTREKLAREGIPLVPHRARLLTREDGERYDLLIGMDEPNLRDIRRIVGANAHKARLLLRRPIADPWYTGDFDEAYRDISDGCAALIEELFPVSGEGRRHG